MMHLKELDDIDNAIINLLLSDARLSYSEVGEKVGLSRVGAKNRIKALEDKGVIKGYHAEVDAISLPETVAFYAYFETRPDAYESIVNNLKCEPCVSLLFKTSGINGIYSICVADNKAARENFVHKVRNDYCGLTGFTTKDIWSVEKGIILPN